MDVRLSVGWGKFYESRRIVRTVVELGLRPSPRFQLRLEYDQSNFSTGLARQYTVAELELPPGSGVVDPLFPGVPPPPRILPTTLDLNNPAFAYLYSGDDVTNRTMRARIDYAFDTDITWNTLVQYDNQSKNLGFNSRFRWIFEPGRELFLILNHNLLWRSDSRDFERGVTEPIIKISWLERF